MSWDGEVSVRVSRVEPVSQDTNERSKQDEPQKLLTVYDEIGVVKHTSAAARDHDLFFELPRS